MFKTTLTDNYLLDLLINIVGVFLTSALLTASVFAFSIKWERVKLFLKIACPVLYIVTLAICIISTAPFLMGDAAWAFAGIISYLQLKRIRFRQNAIQIHYPKIVFSDFFSSQKKAGFLIGLNLFIILSMISFNKGIDNEMTVEVAANMMHDEQISKTFSELCSKMITPVYGVFVFVAINIIGLLSFPFLHNYFRTDTCESEPSNYKPKPEPKLEPKPQDYSRYMPK